MTYGFCIKSKDDICSAVEKLGFVPLFKNQVPGFSIEEHVSPRAWFYGNEPGVWEWKGPVIRETGCAYGKFFSGRPGFISREWFTDFANYRRDGYDFDSRYDDNLAPFQDKQLFDLLNENAPVSSRALKNLGNYRKGGHKGFETIITRLQMQCYVLASNFVYDIGKDGKEYGWGVTEYSTPEKFMGRDFTENVYKCEPSESYGKILRYFKTFFPECDEKILRKMIG